MEKKKTNNLHRLNSKNTVSDNNYYEDSGILWNILFEF